jgi:DNA-binding NarL/FixJ family response regulator
MLTDGSVERLRLVPMKVFIVDDSLIVRARIMTLLSDISDLEVIGHAQNKTEAHSSIKSMLPDVVIIDVQMPGGSGIELLKEIKQFQPPPTTIMFTNYPYAQIRKECRQAGADYFFDKSKDFEKIAQVLSSLAVEKKTS